MMRKQTCTGMNSSVLLPALTYFWSHSSFGIILWEILTRDVPYAHHNDYATFFRAGMCVCIYMCTRTGACWGEPVFNLLQ
jgi:hypothetical protein